MTVAQYEQMLAEQDGACAICRQECQSGRRLSVDHCHATKKIRGLLCSKCNTGIGLFNDMPVLLQRAILYLNSSTHGRKKR